jgi:hypothetical protein
MKKALLLIASIAVAITALAQAPTVHWAKSMGSSSNDYGGSIALDKEGNVYSTGYFNDTVDFDPGLGVYNLFAETAGSSFVSKFDSTGKFIWATKVIGSISSISIDSKTNIYVGGTIRGTTLNDFLSKIDLSGNIIATKYIGGMQILNIAIDALDNVYVSGNFMRTFYMVLNSNQGYELKPGGYIDSYLLKLDSFGNGVWVRQFRGTQQNTNIWSLTTDDSGNILVCGEAESNAEIISPQGGASLSVSDNFIAKLNDSGMPIWTKQLVGYKNRSVFINDIKVDKSGNVYAGGNFRGEVDFDPGTPIYKLTSVVNYSNYDAACNAAFIFKLDKDGNFTWARGFKGNQVYVGDSRIGTSLGVKSIHLDEKGNVYTTGSFQGLFDFDPGETKYFLNSNTGTFNDNNYHETAFISKLNTDGDFIWATSFSDTTNMSAESVCIDTIDNIYLIGSYQGVAEIGINKMISGGMWDIYVAKLNESSIVSGLKKEQNIENTPTFFPNPNNGVFVIKTAKEKAKIHVYNSNASLVHIQTSINGTNIIDIASCPNGLYLVKIISNDEVITIQKIVKQ